MSIKAPQGTQIKINDSSNFMVGIGETLTFNQEGYEITKLEILENYVVIYNEDATRNRLNNGLKVMDEALTNLLFASKAGVSVTSAPTETPNIVDNITVQTSINGDEIDAVITNSHRELAAIQATFIEQYLKGYYEYCDGLKGVFIVKTNENGEPIKQQAKNILIDVETKEVNNNVTR
jgi:hypothetical protein